MVIAQDVDPPWLLIAKADRYATEGDFGLAIRYYREALTQQPRNADALFGLGIVFKSVGDFDEAEEFLLEAIEQSDRLGVPARLFSIRYELADLYRIRREFADYETILTEIVAAADTTPLPPRTVRPARAALRQSFLTSGLDRTLVLFRMQEDGGTQARGDLAEFLTGLGRYAAATDLALAAVMQRMSTLIEALIRRDPEFEFGSVTTTLRAAALYPETRTYADGSLLYRDLYYLASAAWSDGHTARAFEMWQLVVSSDAAGSYANRAAAQLRDPQREPLLVPPE